MMNKKGMMVICGNSIAELEADLTALKAALETGAMMACGGRTLTETEKALNAMRSAMGAVTSSTRCEQDCTCHCCHGCNCEDEEEYDGETCPNCGSTWYEDGECEDCGYSEDDLDGELDDEETACEELPSMTEALEALASGDMDKVIAIAKRLAQE